MTINLTGHDELAIRYIRSWWGQHPEWLATLDDAEEINEIHRMRIELYDQVNEVTEGDLARIVRRDSLDWVYLVGAAIAGYPR